MCGLSALGRRSWTPFDWHMKRRLRPLVAQAVLPRAGGVPVIDRASATDLAFLAMDSGPLGEQIGVILRFEEPTGLEVVDVRRLIAQRIAAVPRLRQRLVGVPFGCGRPIWVDHNAFDIAEHVRSVRCPKPGDDRALLDAAVALVAAPLPRSAPLWSATLVTGLSRGGAALVVVLHHVLADGVGGLGVLAGLVDQAKAHRKLRSRGHGRLCFCWPWTPCVISGAAYARDRNATVATDLHGG
jgi:Wax ester synthase-like Acyl-CoA acyltransferase domain